MISRTGRPRRRRSTTPSWWPSIGHSVVHLESRNVSSSGFPRSDASDTERPRWSVRSKPGAGRAPAFQTASPFTAGPRTAAPAPEPGP